MEWFGAAADTSLIATRAVHFAATVVTAGTFVFRMAVVNPVLHPDDPAAKPFRIQTLRIGCAGLVVTVISGVIWLLLQAASMSGLPFREAMSEEILLTVLNQTQFGLVSEIRIAFAAILALCLVYDRFALANVGELAAALSLTASLAWIGHAGSTLGAVGPVHVTADALHLLAASAWIGGLVSLVLLLAASSRNQASAWAKLARDATERFSSLGLLSVATLILTGVVNTWILAGSFHALVVTEYGQLLISKIAIFAIMLAFAAMNRFWWTPRLVSLSGINESSEALRHLTRNSTIEIALGVVIFVIVGMLGTLHPAIHLL
jgi:putative copper resistance protein D